MPDEKRPIKVLIADDSAIYRKLVEHALSDKQFSLIFARSGREAIQLFKDHEPDLVIVDWVMPDLTGIEICEHVRVSSKALYTYVIILTSKSEKRSVVAALAAGADDYFTKPFDPEELLARAEVGLRIIELHKKIEAQNLLLRELALTVSLTGLPNRRAVEEWSTRPLSAAARYGFSFWIAMADVDHFKSVNDTYGHEAGDEVLKKVAQILKSRSRASDICGRMGGEEFIFVLTHATKANALAVIDRIREELASAVFTFDGSNRTVTASFGLVGFEGPRPPGFNELLSQADSALYIAKRLGRNRIEVAGFAP